MRFRRNVDRTVKIFHEHAQATHMIAMLMGYQNAVESIRIFAQLTHAARDFASAQSGIHQYTSAVSDKQHRVAGRASAKNGNLHCAGIIREELATEAQRHGEILKKFSGTSGASFRTALLSVFVSLWRNQ